MAPRLIALFAAVVVAAFGIGFGVSSATGGSTPATPAKAQVPEPVDARGATKAGALAAIAAVPALRHRPKTKKKAATSSVASSGTSSAASSTSSGTTSSSASTGPGYTRPSTSGSNTASGGTKSSGGSTTTKKPIEISGGGSG